MSTVRLRRMQSDYEAVRRLIRLHPRIDIEGVSGNPPERYRLKLTVASLRLDGTDLQQITEHLLEVQLPAGYPRDAPICRMLTPVFHPNIAPHVVCIGDHWTAAESLDHMIQRVGEMLAFQSYNIKSPLNGQAARWVEGHADQLPVDETEFYVDLATATPVASKTAACDNCGEPAVNPFLCDAGHGLCADCQVACKTCGASLCLSCDQPPCPACVPDQGLAGM